MQPALLDAVGPEFAVLPGPGSRCSPKSELCDPVRCFGTPFGLPAQTLPGPLRRPHEDEASARTSGIPA